MMLNKLCWCYLNAMFQSGQCGVCVINFKKLVVRCGCVQFGFLVSRFRLTNDFRHRQRERRREHRHLIRCECFWVVWLAAFPCSAAKDSATALRVAL